MRRRKRSGQAGFVITMELVLIFTILGLGVLVGIVAIRNAVVKFLLKKQSGEIFVVDSDPAGQKILGKAFDLDEHEAPRVQFFDAGVSFGGVTVNRRVILGVRDDRFTTRHRIFYQNSLSCGVTDLGGAPCDANNPADCQACIVHNGDEEGDNLGIGIIPIEVIDGDGLTTLTGSAQIQQAGGIGYLYPMQGGPSYGVGRDVDSGTGFPGTLYRESEANFCDPAQIRSVWTSQEVVPGEPCLALEEGVTVVAAKCPQGALGGADFGEPCGNVPPADARCVAAGTCTGGGQEPCGFNGDCPGIETCVTTDEQCACPGLADGSSTNNWSADTGANCCPPGSTQGAPGQCEIANDGTIRRADLVTNGTANALSFYVPPFVVSYPVEVDASFTWTTPPDGESP